MASKEDVIAKINDLRAATAGLPASQTKLQLEQMISGLAATAEFGLKAEEIVTTPRKAEAELGAAESGGPADAVDA